MIDIFFSPNRAISDAKHYRNTLYTFLLLLLASIMSFAGTLLWLKSVELKIIIAALVVLAVSLVGTMLMALLVQIAMRILTSRGKYYEALTTLTFPALIGSTGFLIGSLLGLIPYAGVFLMGIVSVFSLLLAYAVLFKAGMELYSTDLLTVIIGLSIVYMAVLMSVYMVVIMKVISAGLLAKSALTGMML